jgi:protein SCO1
MSCSTAPSGRRSATRPSPPATWTLFHGDDDAVSELAAALGVGYRPDGQGGFDHAAVISIIDEKGEIVVQQRGTQASSGELLTALTSLLAKLHY